MAGRFKVVMRIQNILEPANPSFNVFGWKSNLSVLNEEFELSNAFRTQLIPEIVKVLNGNQRVDRVEVYNVDNGIGYNDFVYAAPVAGLRSGDPTNYFVTYGFQYNRVNAGDRNGFKRLGQPVEADLSAGVPIAGMLTILNALAVKLGTALKIALIDTWFPVVLKRAPTGVYPWSDYPVLNVTYKRVTTQNSRKR